jgi:hypothetical protein
MTLFLFYSVFFIETLYFFIFYDCFGGLYEDHITKSATISASSCQRGLPQTLKNVKALAPAQGPAFP